MTKICRREDQLKSHHAMKDQQVNLIETETENWADHLETTLMEV